MQGWFDATEVDPWQPPIVVVNNDPWKQPSTVAAQPRPDFADDEDLKKAYGTALGRNPDNAFIAGQEVFNDAAKALWASLNWLSDPTVIANRDAYIKALKKVEKPLDKDQLLAEILQTSRSAIEDKDKATLLKLYAEVAGFTGKAADQAPVAIDASQNYMTIKLVSPQGKEVKTIDQSPNTTSKIANVELPKLKLVSGSG